MSRWTRLSIRKRLSHEFFSAAGRDFERAVLPWMRIIWPCLHRPPEIGYWDRQGIDLIARGDSGVFETVVQCKGYQVQCPGTTQLSDAKGSISRFLDSGYHAKKYVLVYNRYGDQRDFHRQLEEAVCVLVDKGVAERAEVWSTETLMDRVFDAMRERIDQHLRNSATKLLERYERLFEFRLPFINRVQAAEYELIFQRYRPCELKCISEVHLCNADEIILKHSDARWVLLVGVFGAGKTTSTLHTAISSPLTPIFVPASVLPPDVLRQGTNLLSIEVLRAQGFFNELEDDYPLEEDVSESIKKMAGSVLGYLLRHPDTGYLLVIDGLDENRVYSKLEGFQHLSNQLAEFRCPIILTTRREHLADQFGNFSAALTEASAKYSPKRSARLLELNPWTSSMIQNVVESLLAKVEAGVKENVEEFAKLVREGRYQSFYGDLPSNPLFLGFILEDIALSGIERRQRAQLIRQWVERKIRRDLTQVLRPNPADSLDTEEFVRRMLLLLQEVAGDMVIETNDGWALLEVIEEDRLRKLALCLFPNLSESVLPILLNSVLVPLHFRKVEGMRAGFVFRVLQEFFLASYLIDKGITNDGYPSDVKMLYKEIQTMKVVD